MLRSLAFTAALASVAHADPAKREKPHEQRRTIAYSLLVSGVGLEGAGIGFLVLGAHQNTRIYQGQLATAKDISDTADRGRFYNRGAVVAFSLGTAAAIAGAVLLAITPDDDTTVTLMAADRGGVLLTRRF